METFVYDNRKLSTIRRKYKMKNITWHIAEIEIPNIAEQVIVQCKELPDPTFATYKGDDKGWEFDDIVLSQHMVDDVDLTIIAWTEMPEPYKAD
jgi:hypothetical protein